MVTKENNVKQIVLKKSAESNRQICESAGKTRTESEKCVCQWVDAESNRDYNLEPAGTTRTGIEFVQLYRK